MDRFKQHKLLTDCIKKENKEKKKFKEVSKHKQKNNKK